MYVTQRRAQINVQHSNDFDIPVSVLTLVYLCLFAGKVVYLLKWLGQPYVQNIQYYEDDDSVINKRFC